MKEPPTVDFKNRIDHLLSLFSESNDLYCRYFQLHEVSGCILYHSGITDIEKLQADVLKPLLAAPNVESLDEILPIVELKYTKDSDTIIQGILQGKCAIILDRKPDILLADVGLNRIRSITAPENEQTIRGSHEAYIEDVAVNSHLIHKRLKNPSLVERHFVLGKESLTKASLLYIDGKADPAIVQQITTRLQSNNAKIVKSPGQITEALELNPWSIMPKVLQTERPDTTVAHLAEGKIVLLLDGCSYAIVLPATFFIFFQAADDFNLRWWNGSFFRILRYFGAILTLAMPSVYISIISNHFEVLPIDLVFSLKASLENVPLNPVVEAFFMIIVLELLKEAALRLPKSISPALSTVGGLVIGTEVVSANLVSTTMIVVISLTAVASFTVPNYEMRLALRLISIPIMFASAFMGFAGISFCFSLLVMYLCSLETYGVPYFYPLSPLNPKRLVIAIFQLPSKLIRSRK